MSASRLTRQAIPTPHLCAGCSQPFIQPEFGIQAGELWRVFLHCQSCGWSGQGLFDDKDLERLERELDAERDQISLDLERMTRRNMQEYHDLFVTALRADAILPEDF
jgi:hypothetical protein